MSSAIPIRDNARRTSSARRHSPPALGRLPSSCESPRMSIPKDFNAFTYNPRFLAAWTMPDTIWGQLPETMKKVITTVQHAGAEVLTSFDRLEKLDEKRPQDTATFKDATASDAIAAKLQEHQARTGRTRSSTNKDVEEYDCSPISPEWRKLKVLGNSQTPIYSSGASAGSSGTNSNGWVSPIEAMPPLSPECSFSSAIDPLELGTSRMSFSSRDGEVAMRSVYGAGRRNSDQSTTRSTSRRPSHSVKSFEVPRDPLSTQYHAELEHLRKDSLIRLRHAVRAVDADWANTKLNPTFSPTEDIAATVATKHHEAEFEAWWTEKKAHVQRLDEQGKDLSVGVHFSLGWSDTPGLNTSDI